MRSSSLTALATVALVLARAGLASAQSGPPPAPPPDDPDPAAPADDDDEPDDTDVPATPAAAPPVGDEPSPVSESAADDRPDRAPRKAGDGPLIVVGLELGVGGVVGGGSQVHGSGFGRGFSLGVQWQQTAIEWHFAEIYDAPVDRALVASNTAGQLGMSSLGLRLAPTPFLSVYGGIAKAAVPLLVRESDADVRSASLDGIGPIGGVAIGWSSGTMRFGLELRLARMVITDATPAHLTVTGPADGSGMIPVTTDHAAMHPTIATLTATVRLSD